MKQRTPMWYIYIIVILFSYLTTGYLYADVINIALSNSPANLSPFFSYDSNSQNINRLLHVSLVDLDRKMVPVCRACESFKSINTNQKQRLVFHLQKDLRFWDGTQVTAQDVKDSISYFQDVNVIKSGFRFAFKKIKKVNVLSKFVVELLYEKYDIDHLTDLTLLKILKFKNRTITKDSQSIIGAGPYKLFNSSDARIILDKVKGNRRLVFKVVKDETTLALKLIKKEIDISLANLSPRKLEWIRKNTELKFKEVSSSALQYVAMNEKKGLLNDKRFRRVLRLILPKEQLIKFKLKNSVENATGFFSPSFPAYYKKRERDSYNLKQATFIMKELGAVKKGGHWVYNNKIISLSWLIVNNKNSIELVRIIKSYYEKFGIELKASSQEWGSFYKNFKSGNYDLLMSRWIGFTGPSILRLALHSESIPPKGGNRIYYHSKKVDLLIDKGLALSNKKKRESKISKALSIIDDDYAYIYLWYPKIVWVMQKNISVPDLYPNTSFVPLLNIRKIDE